MAKKDEKLEVQQATETPITSETPNRDKWLANLRGKYGEDKTDEELYDLSMSGYDTEHDANKRYSEEATAFDEIVSANPELAGVFSEIFERGKEGNPAMALRHLPDELKRYITDDEYGDEAYLADKKAREEEASAKAAKDEQTQALREQAFTEVCAEDGVADPEAALKALQDVFENPCETLDQCKEQVRAFLKMVDYDSAVQAAEVRGRNANIAEQRRSVPKTVPQGAGAGIATQPNVSTDIFGEIANSRKKQRDKENA